MPWPAMHPHLSYTVSIYTIQSQKLEHWKLVVQTTGSNLCVLKVQLAALTLAASSKHIQAKDGLASSVRKAGNTAGFHSMLQMCKLTAASRSAISRDVRRLWYAATRSDLSSSGTCSVNICQPCVDQQHISSSSAGAGMLSCLLCWQ